MRFGWFSSHVRRQERPEHESPSHVNLPRSAFDCLLASTLINLAHALGNKFHFNLIELNSFPSFIALLLKLLRIVPF